MCVEVTTRGGSSLSSPRPAPPLRDFPGQLLTEDKEVPLDILLWQDNDLPCEKLPPFLLLGLETHQLART